MYKTTVKLAGVTFPNKDGTSRQDLLGTLYDDYFTEGAEQEIKLELRPEPDNPYDSTAVAVWCVHPEDAVGQIGYVPAEDSESIFTACEEERVKEAYFDDMGCARGNRIWARLVIRMASETGEDKSKALDGHLFTDEDGKTYRVVG